MSEFFFPNFPVLPGSPEHFLHGFHERSFHGSLERSLPQFSGYLFPEFSGCLLPELSVSVLAVLESPVEVSSAPAVSTAPPVPPVTVALLASTVLHLQ